MSNNRGMDKENVVGVYIYIMEYYSAFKSNEIMPCAETWVDLETIKQSEVRQKEKNSIIY